MRKGVQMESEANPSPIKRKRIKVGTQSNDENAQRPACFAFLSALVSGWNSCCRTDVARCEAWGDGIK